jgi:hypothetical protein
MFYRNKKQLKLKSATKHHHSHVVDDVVERPSQYPVASSEADLFVEVDGKRVTKGEWVEVSSNAQLPQGLDIEVDMQTGKRRVRLSDQFHGSANVPQVVPEQPRPENEQEEFSPMAQRKWERKYAALHKTAIDTRLEELASSDPAVVAEAMAFLDEHAHSVDIGAGLVRSRSFEVLLDTLKHEKVDMRLGAADILFACIQNNPDAIKGVLDGTMTVNAVVARLGDEADETVMKRLLSVLIYLVRGDRAVAATQQCAQAATASALAFVGKRMAKSTAVLDRILVLSIELVQQKTYAERDAALNLIDSLVQALRKPYSDWMLHVFRPYCLGNTADPTRTALNAFCKELNANPIDSSVL